MTIQMQYCSSLIVHVSVGESFEVHLLGYGIMWYTNMKGLNGHVYTSIHGMVTNTKHGPATTIKNKLHIRNG